MPVGVDVRVLGSVGREEDDFWRVKRISIAKNDAQLEDLPHVQRRLAGAALWAQHFYRPSGHGLALEQATSAAAAAAAHLCLRASAAARLRKHTPHKNHAPFWRVLDPVSQLALHGTVMTDESLSLHM